MIALNEKGGRKSRTDCIWIDSIVISLAGNVSYAQVTWTSCQRIETLKRFQCLKRLKGDVIAS